MKTWRRNTKVKIVTAMGDCCQICGYSRCIEALELHHLNPSTKDFSFGDIIANPRKWAEIAKELTKCVLLCACCHREVHFGTTSLPDTYKVFDASKLLRSSPMSKVADLDLVEELRFQSVAQLALMLQVSASFLRQRLKKLGTSAAEIRAKYPEVLELSAFSRRKVSRPSKPELSALLTICPLTKIGEKFGVTDNAIRKWCVAYGISPNRTRKCSSPS